MTMNLPPELIILVGVIAGGLAMAVVFLLVAVGLGSWIGSFVDSLT